MEFVIGGYQFSSQPTTQIGRVFMTKLETGEGTEIDEVIIQEALNMLFEEVM